MRIGDHAVGLLGLYVPSRGPKERRNEDKRAFQNAVEQALPGLLKEFTGSVVVSGDLNVVEPGHTPHYAVFGTWEYDFYRAFLDTGLTDAFRHVHPDAVDHSWFGRGGNGYRFDHIFVTAGHKDDVQVCQYLHEPRELGLTDHSAMLLRLALG